MMPCEDAEFLDVKPVESVEEMPDHDDAQTPEEGYEYVGMEVVLPGEDGYHIATAAHKNQSEYR